MSALGNGAAAPSPGTTSERGEGAASLLGPTQWRQLAWITAGALAIFIAMRLLPTGTNLSHMDFRVDPKTGNAIEFCDPLNPQFIPVVAARSPVTMAITTASPATAGSEVRATVTLRTSSGKPIAPEDLVFAHTRKLHLLIIDPTLGDYQHVHPEPAHRPGDWTFSFLPRLSGVYRVFADFTPAATTRGLYASVDVSVGGPRPPAAVEMALGDRHPPQRGGYRFTLAPVKPPRAGEPLDLRFTVTRDDGAPIALIPVMDAFAHLVAFDAARSGFAHLHPAETDLRNPPGGQQLVLNFKLTIPRAGPYVVWAQVNLEGKETFVPFGLEVK